jgi:hypothetical protein
MKDCWKSKRKVCISCRRRPARYQRHGIVRLRHDHNLCSRCWRAELNRFLARVVLAELDRQQNPFPRSLSAGDRF